MDLEVENANKFVKSASKELNAVKKELHKILEGKKKKRWKSPNSISKLVLPLKMQ